MPDEPKNDLSQKSPAEGDRDTVERELKRQEARQREEKDAERRKGEPQATAAGRKGSH